MNTMRLFAWFVTCGLGGVGSGYAVRNLWWASLGNLTVDERTAIPLGIVCGTLVTMIGIGWKLSSILTKLHDSSVRNREIITELKEELKTLPCKQPDWSCAAQDKKGTHK